MKAYWVKPFGYFLIFLLIFGHDPKSRDVLASESSPVLFGSSKIDITPPIGTPLSGYGRRHGKRSKGVRDPLYARVISLSNEKQTFFFVSLDLVLIDSAFRNRVLEKVRAKIKLDDSQVVMFATHTHSGSGAIGKRFWERFIGGKFKKKVFERMTDEVAGAIVSAQSNREPVWAEYGSADASRFVENRMDKNLVAPVPFQVVRFKTQEQVVAGQMVFFAAHPTILSAQNRHFSGDFPAVLTHYLEAEHPNSIALFANGATGDLRPTGLNSDYPEKRLEQYGRELYEVSRELKFEPLDLGGTWTAEFERVKLPNVKVRAGFLTIPSWIGNRFFPRRAVFQMLQMGRVCVTALPLEVASETGRAIEERISSYGFVPLVATYANDFLGYVIPERYYRDRRQYEARASFYGKQFEFFVHQKVDQLLASVLRKSKLDQAFVARGTAVKGGGLPLIYLKGTPYELGIQHGKLMSNEIRAAKKQIYNYLGKKGKVPFIAKPIAKWILIRSWKKMEPFVSYDEWMEMKGLAEGSVMSFKDVKRLHAIPDLIESLCTNGVYFGSATKDGKLIHIRNLDWVREMGVYRLAAVILYEPQWGNRYANLGYYGFIGSLTGVNERGISVGQVGADSIDESLSGTPMPFLLKRVLMKSKSLDDAVSIITKSGRTSSFNYVFADAQENKAVAIETTHRLSRVFLDDDPLEASSGYGFPMKGVLMRADPAFDPAIRDLQTCSHGKPKKKGIEPPSGSAYETRYKRQAELVKQNYGKMDVDRAREIAQTVAPDSNIQSTIIQFPDVWVANANDTKPAAKTEYYHFNFSELFDRLKQLAESEGKVK